MSAPGRSLSTEDAPCPLCGHDALDVVYADVPDHLFDTEGRWSVARCASCGLKQTVPRLTTEGLAAFYDEAYTETLAGFHSSEAGDAWLVEYRLNVIRKVYRPGPDDHLLDLGCSFGQFLHHAAQDTGARCTGVDLDEATVARARAHERITYLSGAIEDVDIEPASVSVATLYHVLEHTTDPVGTLRRVGELLRPDGLLVVEVPDWGSWWRLLFRRHWLPLMVPQHLLHFDAPTLRRTLAKAGFTEMLYHKPMFVPLELMASMGLVLKDKLGLDPHRGVVQAALMLLWLTVDIPTQLILRIIGRTAQQVIIARRPT